MSVLVKKWKGYVKIFSLMSLLFIDIRYCKEMNLSDYDVLMIGIKESFMVFFMWFCDILKIQKQMILLGYKRVFKMMYEKLVGMVLSLEIYEVFYFVREVYNGLNKMN